MSECGSEEESGNRRGHTLQHPELSEISRGCPNVGTPVRSLGNPTSDAMVAVAMLPRAAEKTAVQDIDKLPATEHNLASGFWARLPPLPPPETSFS